MSTLNFNCTCSVLFVRLELHYMNVETILDQVDIHCMAWHACIFHFPPSLTLMWGLVSIFLQPPYCVSHPCLPCHSLPNFSSIRHSSIRAFCIRHPACIRSFTACISGVSHCMSVHGVPQIPYWYCDSVSNSVAFLPQLLLHTLLESLIPAGKLCPLINVE